MSWYLKVEKHGIMKNKKHIEPTGGVLTNRMDTGTKEFNEFQALLLNKSKDRSEKQKKQIEFTARKFKMEDHQRSGEDHHQAE